MFPVICSWLSPSLASPLFPPQMHSWMLFSRPGIFIDSAPASDLSLILSIILCHHATLPLYLLYTVDYSGLSTCFCCRGTS